MTETVKNLIKALIGFLCLLFAHKAGFFFYGSAFTIVFLQLWIILSLLAIGVYFAKSLKINILAPLLLLVSTELFFLFSFRTACEGGHLSGPFTAFLRQMYFERCRNVCFDDEITFQYDSTLFYTLPPGQHVFSNLEFQTHYEVNSQGFRDDESSLGRPEIIFLGDSYTMGWGVEKAETFEAILEERLAQKCLNTGIASYGTARELLTLDRLDLSACKLLVLQFCKNYREENRTFIARGNRLPISPKSKLESSGNWNRLWKSYFPLKYCYVSFFQLWNNVLVNLASNAALPPLLYCLKEEEVEDFFHVISRIREQFDGPVLIFNINEQHEPSTIYHQFRQYLQVHPVEQVYLLNTDDRLTPGDYFIIDDHLNANGHRKLAHALEEFILKMKLKR